MHNKHTKLALLLLSASLALPGCYRVPVPQGNSLSVATLKHLRVGMSNQEVIQALGNPVLNNAFSDDQIVYVYSYKAKLNPIRIKRLYIYFTHDHVTRWQTTETNPAKP